MILKSLKLKNIRSYTEQKIIFPKKSFILSGDIGSGKSTILLAIEFALFGLMRGLTTGNVLLRKGTDEGYVDLSFEIDNKQVRVKRGLKRQRGAVTQISGSLEIDGARQEFTPVEIKARILDILGYPKELLTKSKGLIYRYTVFTPQEEMKSILFEDKDARLDTLRKVFGFDKYQRIKDNAQLYAKHLKDRRKLLEGYISDIAEKVDKKKENDSYIGSINEKIASVTPELKIAKDSSDKLREELKELDKNIQRRKDIGNKIEVINERVIALVEERKRLSDENEKLKIDLKKDNITIDEESILKLRKEIKDLDLQIMNDLKRYKEFQDRLSIEKSRFDIVRNDLVNSEKRLSEIKVKELDKDIKVLLEKKKEELAKVDDIIKDSEGKKILLKSRIDQSNIVIKKISELDQCPTCEQDVPVDHKKSIIMREEEQISSNELRLSQIPRLDRQSLLEDIAELEKRYQESLMIEKENERAEKEKRELKERIKELRTFDASSIEKLEHELKLLDTTERRLLLDDLRKKESALNIELVKKKAMEELRRRFEHNSKLFEATKERIADNNKEKIKLQDELSDLKIEGYEDKKERLSELEKVEREKQITVAELRTELETYLKIQTDLELELEKKHKKKAEFDKTSSYIQWFEEYFVKMTERFERQVMMSVFREFNELFKTWFNMLIEDELLNVRLDTEFTPIIEQNGYETDVSSLSGGEKTSCALAYRLALNKVINDVMGTVKTKDLIILDEPTDGFSSEQLDRLRDVIEVLDIPQIIIVSHENKIESFVEDIIRVSKQNHESIIS